MFVYRTLIVHRFHPGRLLHAWLLRVLFGCWERLLVKLKRKIQFTKH
jgi:hypothetical protein